jgi:antitoxin component YwqK of YwqJK toxin-antitoxin module
VFGVYTLQAQNLSVTQIASITNISEIKIPVVYTLAVQPVAETMQTAEYYIGKKYKGTWQSHYSNGNPCDSGFLYENIPDGLWKCWYPNGQLRVEMECSAKRMSATIDEMQRIYKPGYSPGPGITQMRQVMATSSYSYDKIVYGQLYVATHPPDLDNSIRRVNVQVQQGNGVNTFTTETPPFTECLVHGVYKTYFDNGLLQDSGYCENGIREGVWEEWDEEQGMRAVGFYKGGLRWKDWRFYNKEGKIQFVKRYNRTEEVTETIVLK